MIVFSIGLALVVLMAQLLLSCFSDNYFFSGSQPFQVMLSPLFVAMSTAMVVIQILVINVVLRRYSELEALGRQSLCQFLIGMVFTFPQLKSVM